MPGADIPDFSEKVGEFINDLKYGRVLGSYNIASTTVKLLRRLIAQSKTWVTVRDLMDIIREEGLKLMMAQPSDTVVGNMVRRVLKIVREEYARLKGKCEEGETQESLQKLLLDEGNGEPDDYKSTLPNLKAAVIESIGELLSELETSTINISMQALEHIHSNEVVMTAGKSRTVEAFLKHAARKRKFEVFVAECAPFYHGQELACSLAKANISTTVITDSAVFAMMARVNKVIMGTNTVMANGGLKAINGCHAMALAAKHYSVPFVVCTPMYKLSPEYLCCYDQDAFNKFVSPQNVMKFSEGHVISHGKIYNPVYDYVPPDLVTLFISNIGGNAPSYVYRLLNEMYHPDDFELGTIGQRIQ